MKITINKNKYDISFNFGVLKNVCKECKCTVPKVLEKASLGDLEILGSIIKYGVLFNDADFNTDEIELMTVTETINSFVVVGALLNDSMPKGDKDEKKKS